MDSASSSSLVRFQVREVDITPPIGIHIRNWSAAQRRTASGIHRPLIGTVLALSSGSGETVLISLDLGWWMSSADEALLRNAVIEAVGLRADQVIVCLTHTHSGPSLSRADRDKPGGALIEPWLDRITGELAAAADEARRDLRPGILDFEVGTSDLATNRDLALPDGSVVCGFNPHQPALDRLLLGRICDDVGVVRVVLAHYAAHPTSLGPENTLLSPDYLGAARELVETATGAAFVFVQGPSGELAPREQYAATPEVADKNGRAFGHAVLATLERMAPAGKRVVFERVRQSGAPLGITRLENAAGDASIQTSNVTVQLHTQDNRPPEDDDVPAAVAADRVERAARVGANAPVAADVDFTVTLWRIGRVIFLAHPGEAYSDLQTMLQADFPHMIIAVINLANGSHQGYVAPAVAYGDHRYQSWQSPLAADAFDTLYGALSQVLSDETQFTAPRTSQHHAHH